MSNKIEYDTILSLARKNNFKKIMIMRYSCIVNSIEIKPNGEHCKTYGYIKYANGNTFNGHFPADNTYSQKLIKVLDEDIKVIKSKNEI